MNKERLEMDCAAEMYEMIAPGWTDEEAREKPEAFLERVGAEGLTAEEVWKVWEYVWQDHCEEAGTAN